MNYIHGKMYIILLCALCCVNDIHGRVYMEKRNTRVRTRNLGGLRKRTNEVIRDVEVYWWLAQHY